MKICFERPWFLVMIPILLLYYIYTARKLKLNKFKKTVLLTIRSFIIVILVFSLCGINFMWKTKDTTTMFLVDCSDSVTEYKGEFEKFIKESLYSKNKNDSVGIMCFGENAVIDNFISKNITFSGVDAEIIKSHTDIENAIVNALMKMGEKNKKRIVLLTDGKETMGTSSKLVSTLNKQNVDLKVYRVDSKKNKNEVAIEEVKVPENVRVGQEFEVIVKVNSNVNTECNISLFSDNLKTGEKKVNISKGENKFIFKDKANTGGFKTYKVSIDPKLDGELRNNEFSAFTNVKDKTKILVIEDEKKDAIEILNMLKASNIDFEVVKAGAECSNVKDLSKYKVIITCNVPCENLSEGFLNSIKTYVKDLGGGLIAIGGDNSFALGGYVNTPLEEVLPVNMNMKGKKEIPKVSMMLVVDKSGSMCGQKMELAKKAAIETVDLLRNKDEIGILAFDDSQYWVVKRQNLKDKKDIKDSIKTIQGGGDTSILPALCEAYDSLKSSDAEIKHVILLTDGCAENKGYDTLIQDFKNKDITVSTVAVGSDSDRALLENIAKKARGRFYYTNDFYSIPKIFTKETFTITRTYLNNRKFNPIIETKHPILSGVYENGIPNLLGYIGSSGKKTSKVILKSPEDDPILTIWQYGLGKTVAWNSDMNGKWSKNFINWEKNLNLWQNIVNWTTENYSTDSMELSTKIEGSNGIIDVENNNIDTNSLMEAEVITPSMKKIKIPLIPSQMNRFSGKFKLDEIGAYMVMVKQLKEKKIINTVMGGMALQYSPEYSMNNKESTLDTLIKETGGKKIDTPKEVFQGKIKDTYSARNMSTFCIALALILFLIDIAVRRLDFPYKKFKSKLKVLKNKVLIDYGKKEDNHITNLKEKKEKLKENNYNNIEGQNENLQYKEKSQYNHKSKNKNFKNVEENKMLNTSELLKVKNKKR